MHVQRDKDKIDSIYYLLKDNTWLMLNSKDIKKKTYIKL